ncbi:bifunctional glutamate N-acetyltransferase/amino-acid acetyltransferase ArgJ [Porticoccaceae bacterium]|nr:bifunctional glutamate N-acetyltransferase/amino-acid acetyltransferase ArgJ [Porticoccaceae bacterium]
MATGSSTLPQLHDVAGIRLGSAMAGIKKIDHRDTQLIEIAPGSSVSAVFTRNAFCAAPVQLAKSHLAQGVPRYLLINTGNANAGTGRDGLAVAQRSCAELAQLCGVQEFEVLPFSTGVIGEHLPAEKLIAALPAALDGLSVSGWSRAATTILTTDTRPKAASRQFLLEGKTVTITGICKGSGMIKPNMATMLGYVASDAKISQQLLDDILRTAVDSSFNRITVDSDTSTNDAVVLMATGASQVEVDSDNRDQFSVELNQLFVELAQSIIRDGEGASKFVEVTVAGGKTRDEALAAAYAVAESPLVKTALAASDPNWGRILAAIGRAGIEELDVDKISIGLNGVSIVENGGRAVNYTEEAGQVAMASEDIVIAIELGRGEIVERVWTCDLTYEYVRINAEYRT